MNKTSSISFSLDSDGFLSQECPTCVKIFKTKPGSGSEKPIGFCPYCGYQGLDCWWTTEQVEYIQGMAQHEFVNPLLNEFQDSLKSSFNKYASNISVKADHINSTKPLPPGESDSPMNTTVTECCNESIKHSEPISFCLACGKVVVA
jgi:hypothetical protein